MANIRFDPTRDILDFQKEMNRLFNRFIREPRGDNEEDATMASWYPRVDISETRDEYTIVAEIPGMNKKDIQITYADGLLTIQGERKPLFEEKDRTFHRVEGRYGKFYRSFNLPSQVNTEGIQAEYKDGLLIVHLPKVEEKKAKAIEIK